MLGTVRKDISCQSDDKGAVALDPGVRGEEEGVEPDRAAILRLWGGWSGCLPSSVQSSAIIRRGWSASGSFQSATYSHGD